MCESELFLPPPEVRGYPLCAPKRTIKSSLFLLRVFKNGLHFPSPSILLHSNLFPFLPLLTRPEDDGAAFTTYDGADFFLSPHVPRRRTGSGPLLGLAPNLFLPLSSPAQDVPPGGLRTAILSGDHCPSSFVLLLSRFSAIPPSEDCALAVEVISGEPSPHTALKDDFCGGIDTRPSIFS